MKEIDNKIKELLGELFLSGVDIKPPIVAPLLVVAEKIEKVFSQINTLYKKKLPEEKEYITGDIPAMFVGSNMQQSENLKISGWNAYREEALKRL